ncbi:TAXI family TRAP transporter solute-binding subunit [Mesobacillus zeae]|uniref:TAXI family TRAP transporter solute-binding subunit n=1 Tax=Mesobacillus zeae TaxID=1917180 RepID=A0A398B2F0_9BACI|nr:TAXI family TRAP transporter solute-binding subunit [Mesobacillus zeae]RID81966.1 TAXI family TRAP transporter solute-binding subunit [Mesobacillus zeae]
MFRLKWGVITLIMMVFLAGCSNNAKVNESDHKRPDQKKETYYAGKPLTILTGGTSGVYFQLGNAMAKIYGEEVGALASAQTTGASAENTAKVSRGKAEIGFAMADTVADAYNGQGNFAKYGALKNIRAIASLYPNYMQIVTTKSSGIKTLEDLKGKDLAVGALGSGTEIMAKRILKGAGLTYDDVNADFLSFSEGIEGIKNGTTDVAFLSSGYPNSGIMELAAVDDVVIIPVPEELTLKMKKKFPAIEKGSIPANTYKGAGKEVPTVKVSNVLVTNEDLPDEAVYELTKTLFDNLDDLQNAHSAAGQIDVKKSAENLPLPLHPGAKKYYEEKGILQ